MIYANGFYGEDGYWQKTKYCFVSCGTRCDCGPPGGLRYNPSYDFHKPKDLMDTTTANEYKPSHGGYSQ